MRIGLTLAVLAFASLPLAAQESVEDKLRPSVVRIRNEESSGSGMFLDADGLILTNAHVACSPLPFQVGAFAKVRGAYQEVTFTRVTLLGFHPEYDLALLRVDPSECDATVKPVTIAAGAPLGRERVWAIGFPGDHQGGKMKVATWGEMRTTDKDFYGMSYYEMDLSVTHGNSGGPLCNGAGQVIGVVSAISPDGNALAIPITVMKRERFGPLKDRAPNRQMSTLITGWAEEELTQIGKGPPTERVMMLYETALLWDNGNAALYARVGQLNQQVGRSSAAVAYLVRSLQMQPWAEKAETYRSLGLALVALGKADEALTVWKEGLEKYPLDNAQLWSDFATFLEKRKRYPEAALSARLALKSFNGRSEEMNDLYQRAHAQLSPADLQALRGQESDLDNHLGRMRSTSDKARRDGVPFLSADAEKVVTTMTGVQKEAGAGVGRIPPGRVQPLKMSDEELDVRFIRGRIEVAKEHLRNGLTDKATEILDDVIKTYPAHPETESARLLLKVLRRK